MKLCVSHIAWPFELNEQAYQMLQNQGVEAIEAAPTKIWPDIFQATVDEARAFCQKLNKYNLKVAGFHALLYGQNKLSIFADGELRGKTITYLKRLAELCEWVGGKTLVFGSPPARARGQMSYEQAMDKAVEFFKDLLGQCRDYNVIFVIEPLGQSETDFIVNAKEGLDLIKRINHPKFRGHLDAKALFEAGEIREDVFQKFSPYLKHFHVNASGLAMLDENDKIGHKKIGRLLKRIKYQGYVSLEQRPDTKKPLEACLHSVQVMKKYYG